MGKKKESETIRQQRKAREDFLELKKMQTGEIEAGPKPSEITLEPMTFSDKLQNFWYHFKWHTIGILFLFVGFVVIIAQCASRKNWDMIVVYFTYTPVMDEQTAMISDYLESISRDINSDEEVNIQVVNCSMPTDSSNVQYSKTILSKLQSLIAVEEKALLYITDEESIHYFDADAVKGIFEESPVPLDDRFYSATVSEDFGPLPEGLQISCRNVPETATEKNENIKSVYDESRRIIHILKEKN